MTDSRIPGLYKKRLEARLAALVERNFLSAEDAAMLRRSGGMTTSQIADKMTENVIGVFGLPLSVAPNFLVNERDYVVPMVIEEPSVVAGVSAAAALARHSGGFRVTSDKSILYGQVQIVDVSNPAATMTALQQAAESLIASMNDSQPRLVARGGGVRNVDFVEHQLPDGKCIVAMIAVDTCDAMGANLVNSICEFIAPKLEDISAGRACLRILSNLADGSLVTASCRIPLSALSSGEYSPHHVRDNIVRANELAIADPYRAATHNKGVMNGIDAVAIATGNDWRAIEAGIHAYAARDGRYRSLTNWSVADDGDLLGEMTLPLKVGIVGGSSSSNPAATLGLRIAAVDSATELSHVICAVGLAQNFAALRAMAGRGIQHGHMRLHARSVASQAGATPEMFDQVVAGLIDSGEVKDWKARELVAQHQVAADGAANAAGKVILFGEHAVVYGSRALAVPMPDSVSAVCAQADGQHICIPAWGIREQSGDGDAGTMLARLLQLLDAEDAKVGVDVQASIPPAMGLGASAALAAATCRALAAYFDLDVDDEQINDWTFECEKIAHGTPSGIDNSIAVFQQPMVYAKDSVPPISALSLRGSLPLVVACSSQSGSTREQVEAVRKKFDADPERFGRLFDEIDSIAGAAIDAIQAGDLDELGHLMDVNHGLLNAIGVSTPELEQMIHLARTAGASGAKLTGGGGGGSIVAFCPGSVDRVKVTLQQAGYRTMEISGTGTQ